MYRGCIEEHIEKDGNVTFIEYDKPQWHLFEKLLFMSECSGKLFKTVRDWQGITQKEIASKAGISLYMVRKIENSKNLDHYNQKTLSPEFDGYILKKLFCALGGEIREVT